MKASDAASLGAVAELYRYPVKSMGGEALEAAPLTERGLLGDRAYVVLDRETGTVASAKHPRRWAALLACAARYVTPPAPGLPLPPVAITLPDGGVAQSDDPEVDAQLSRALGRAVALVTRVPGSPTREADRTPVDAPDGPQAVSREPLALGAPGTFFDYGPLHLLTTATLAYLQARYPAGDFDRRRFRPNLLIATGDSAGCVEHGWLGQTLAIGAAARVEVFDPCPRCVVTTLAQGNLPRDPGILRAITEHSAAPSVTLAPGVVFPAVAGVYARLAAPGPVRRGDLVQGLERWSV